MSRRKERQSIKVSKEDLEEPVAPFQQRLDPQELRIYIKQLTKALKFLPLGSRPYYAVTGELLRANTQLKALVTAPSTPRGQQ